jgi:hypothetical protein
MKKRFINLLTHAIVAVSRPTVRGSHLNPLYQSASDADVETCLFRRYSGLIIRGGIYGYLAH